MADNVIITLADAVVARLNAGDFSQEFTAVRAFLPLEKPEDVADLSVLVVPRATARVPGERRLRRSDIDIDVAVQKRVASESAEELDPLMLLAREIDAFCYQKTFGPGTCIEVENIPIYLPNHLREKRLFTSIVRLTMAVFE